MTAECACSCGNCTDLPVTPFQALRVSYGMLLGEDDFRVLMGNPRGKQMLHSSWLHGSGVVWGYRVGTEAAAGGPLQLRVSPGLGVDGLGREVELQASSCLNLQDWLKTCDDPPDQDGCGSRTVHACLVAEFDCCLSNPVPALADPCDVNRSHDYESRVTETARIELRPGRCRKRRRPYHRVRVLLGLDELAHEEGCQGASGCDCSDRAGRQALAARELVAAAAPADRPRLLARELRRLAAWDGAELGPAVEPGTSDPTLFPVLEQDAAVVLACLELDLRDADGCTTITDVRIDLGCRSTLLPTATLTELCCGLAPGLVRDEAGSADDAGGPRVFADGVAWSEDGLTLVIPVSAPLVPGSLRHAITVTSLSARGWVEEDLSGVGYDPELPAIVVSMVDRPTNALLRLRVKGTGTMPVYGAEPLVPLAGVWGGPPGTADDGHDVLLTFANRPTENGES
ncbi:hypothetical protein [Jatrophihabitans sp.]|uniref:hypothetical protein n=1 Tax=Jatrophihabitans sp. TaxID=1932789 RepID=UPI002C2BE9B7|nr:hypothetical protein [Jatrophihabitans sp.]